MSTVVAFSVPLQSWALGALTESLQLFQWYGCCDGHLFAQTVSVAQHLYNICTIVRICWTRTCWGWCNLWCWAKENGGQIFSLHVLFCACFLMWILVSLKWNLRVRIWALQSWIGVITGCSMADFAASVCVPHFWWVWREISKELSGAMILLSGLGKYPQNILQYFLLSQL